MKKRTLLNAIVSDIHAGSDVGLMPPDFVRENGQEIKQNAIQRWLWDCWRMGEDFLGEVANGDPYDLTVNGDVIEGNHHATKQIISPLVDDHIACAEDVLRPLATKADQVFIVSGTECHTGNAESTVGKIFNAQRDPDSNKRGKNRSFDRLFISHNDCPCAFSHHIGASIRDYTEATQLSIALNQELVHAVRNGEVAPRVVVRSHRHKFGMFTNGTELFIVTPPWQALTRFGHKVVPGARCHPGIVILDWRGKEPGELPHVHYKLYEAPKQTLIQR